MIPSIFALYTALRKVENANALLALILFLVGTIIFVSGNTALTMLDLSNKYFLATTDMQKNLIAAAGEAMLIKGAQGGLGVFIGFALPTFANIIMSFVMIEGKIFSKATSYIGFFCNTLMLIYIILATFIGPAEKLPMVFAMPGGLLLIAWMIMFTIKLFKLRLNEN